MNSSEILSNTDRTSWKRVKMVMKYFWPSLRPMVIIYPLLAVALVLMMHNLGADPAGLKANGLLEIVAWAFMLAPCFLTRQPNGEAFYSLPALGWEKCEAIFLMMFIGVPLLFLPLDIYGVIVGREPTVSVMAVPIRVELTSPFILMTILSALTSQCAALWAVFAARRHRALKAVGAALGFMFINGILGFIVGLLSALTDPHSIPVEATMQSYMAMLVPYFLTFWAVAFLFVAYMATRVICRKQL